YPAPPAFLLWLRGDVDLDRPRFRFLTQRQPHGEDAVLVLGRHTARIDGLRQRERPAEGAVAPLNVVILLFLHLVRQLFLALDRQHEVLDGDVDVLARHVGQLGLQHELVIARLKNINGRYPRIRRREAKIAEWIPTYDSHVSSKSWGRDGQWGGIGRTRSSCP